MRKNQNAEIRKPEILENYYQVIAEEGLEGASIGKIAKRMNIHPSLIIHYFKTKNNMTIELVDLIIEKFEAPQFLQFDHIESHEERLAALMDTIFSKAWSKTVDISVFYCFYYLSFRNEKIRRRFEAMFKRFRDYLVGELECFRESGAISVRDVKAAADIIVTLMEGLEFHVAFLSRNEPFEKFADYAKNFSLKLLTGQMDPMAGPTGGPEFWADVC